MERIAVFEATVKTCLWLKLEKKEGSGNWKEEDVLNALFLALTRLIIGVLPDELSMILGRAFPIGSEHGISAPFCIKYLRLVFRASFCVLSKFYLV